MSTLLSKSVLTKAALVLFAATTTVVACAPMTEDTANEELTGADEDTASHEDGLTGTIAVGTKLESTTNVNLRTGPSTDYTILHVVPTGGKVTIESSTPQNGFYKVKHDGTTGWTHGNYYTVVDTTPDTGSGDGPRAQAMDRAKAGVGFSYWWGHGRFSASGPTSSNKGSCSGSCPSCSHSGQFGGDCSGYAAKVWRVPSSNDTLSDDSHPYSTVNFNQSSSQWSTISRANIKMADAMVYNTNGAGHIFIYDKGDPWGSLYSYECKGCSYGCVAGYRTASSAYKAIRKAGW